MLAPTEAEACSAFDSELFFSRRPNQHFSLADHISDGNGVYEDSFSCEVQNQAVVNKIQEAMAATEIANTLIGAQASEPEAPEQAMEEEGEDLVSPMSNLSLDASNPAAVATEVNNPELDATTAAQERESPDERQPV